MVIKYMVELLREEAVVANKGGVIMGMAGKQIRLNQSIFANSKSK